MKISEQPMDRMVTNKRGDMIHCHIVNVYSSAYDLAGWSGKDGTKVYGVNQTTGERITDPDYKVLPWSERQAILAEVKANT